MRLTLQAVIAIVLMTVATASPAPGTDGDGALRVDRGELSVKLPVGGGLRRATFYGSDVCLDDPGRVRITGVALAKPEGGAVVTDYRVVRGWNGMPGAADMALDEVREIPRGTVRIANRCDRRDRAYWGLYVEVTKPAGSSAAGGTGLRIRYRNQDGVRAIATSVSGLYVCRRMGTRACEALGS